MKAEPLRARLVDPNTIVHGGVRLSALDPINSLCRRLIADGHDPQSSLKVWKGARPIRLVHAICNPDIHTNLKSGGGNAQ